MDFQFLHPYFLGPNAENQSLFEDLLLEFLRDHAYWRKNFHPEDLNAVPTSASYKPFFQETIADVRRELRELSSELKNAAPFFSPRYIGHMNSDLLMPALIAQMMTMMYNPNNVAQEAGPATVPRELEVGFQLARMFGYNTDPTKQPMAWGHLTSGGTVANYEGLWNLREAKYYPLSLARAAAELDLVLEAVGPLRKALHAYDNWELVNFSVQDALDLAQAAGAMLREQKRDRSELELFDKTVKKYSYVELGAKRFFEVFSDLQAPIVIVPITAHYSWDKSMKILGLGGENLIPVAIDDRMRMRTDHLSQILQDAFKRQVPVLCVVSVLGSTEFSSFDPLQEIVELREDFYEEGRFFGIHVDAAWGGYMASMFRRENGGLCEQEEVREELHFFPSDSVYETFASLPEADSITVDPHKLGYIPYPCGAFVARDMRIVDLIGQKASYLYDIRDDQQAKSSINKLKNLGQYILEGSKPGSAAAAVYVSHRVLPLHKQGFGALVKRTIKASEYFYRNLMRLAVKLERHVHLRVPFEPDSNIVCFAVNPKGNRNLALMNHYGRTIFDHIKINPRQPLQMKNFIGSYTSLSKSKLDQAQAERILALFDLDPDGFITNVVDPQQQADHIFMFRHSLMSPWLLQRMDGENYIDKYMSYLESLIMDTLGRS